MSDIFKSSKSCIARAKHHIQDLKRQTFDFFRTNPYTIISEIDADNAEEVIKFKFTEPLPEFLFNIAADAANNLRFALDQAIYALSFGKGGRFAYFPFASDAVNFENGVKGKCKHLHPEIANLVRGFKAYKGGNNLLWTLHELCNTNKHALIRPIVLNNASYGIRGGSKLPSAFILRGNVGWDREKNEMELYRQPIGATSEMDFEFSFFIAISDVEFIGGQEAIAVLDELARIVESIVMALEAEAKRLGLV
jgi:hypothetical protein